MILKNVKLNGTLTDIETDGGIITAIGKSEQPGRDMHGLTVHPGLIDIHSHGCIGYDTMEGNIPKMAEWELRHGITTWYPTTMTMGREDIISALSAETYSENGANIPGFHMEGPFINAKHKGAQNEDFIVPPSMDFLPDWSRVKMVTIAPECAPDDSFIRECPAVVSIGHTDADYDCSLRAFAAGAKCLTHTFNAMPPIHHRAPGPIGAGAMRDDVYAQLICDGRHVHMAAVKMLISIFGEDRVVLISDSMRATGLGDGEYMFGGQRIHVTGGAALTEDDHLAGSTTNLFDCVKVAISFGIPEDTAVKMASENPARLMGLNKGKVTVGADADLIFTDKDMKLHAVLCREKLHEIA